jgi:hypothetical protein
VIFFNCENYLGMIEVRKGDFEFGILDFVLIVIGIGLGKP